MVSLLVLTVMVGLSWSFLRSGSPMKVFVGTLLSCGSCSYVVWLEGQDLYGIAMFLAVGGSLLAAFGFILCLVPWQLAMKEEAVSVWWLAVLFVIGLVFAASWGFSPHGAHWSSTVRLYGFSGFMTSEAVLILALLLFGVMTLLMKLAPLKGGGLRRKKASSRGKKWSD